MLINPLAPDSLKPVVTLRPVWGNLATKHDRSPAKLEKTLRGQFGSFYDQKKIGNNWRRKQGKCQGGGVRDRELARDVPLGILGLYEPPEATIHLVIYYVTAWHFLIPMYPCNGLTPWAYLRSANSVEMDWGASRPMSYHSMRRHGLVEIG
jgi:hypothetical protein